MAIAAAHPDTDYIGIEVHTPGVGSLLKQVEWSIPAGKPISVSLLQGNISQDLKWQPEEVQRTLNTYLDLARTHPAAGP